MTDDTNGAPDEETAAALIDHIYSVIRAPETLPQLIERITDWIEADMALMTSPALPGCRPAPLVVCRMDFGPVMSEPALLMRPEFSQRALATGRAPGVFSFEELMPEAERAESEYWRKVMAPLGIASGILTAIRTPADNLKPVALNLFRKEGSPPFGSDERAAMEELLPHLRRMLGILLDAPAAAPEISALSQAYGAVDTPIFYLDGDAKVVFLNNAAETLIDARDGLTLTDGHLRLDHFDAQRDLDEALARVVGDEWSNKFRTGAELLAPRRSGAAALMLVATPVAASNPIATVSAKVRCVLFVYDEEEGQTATLEARLQHLYGLTASEVEIALALAAGKSLQDIADARRTKKVTVRTQLAAILNKTGARRQAQLVSMILRLQS